jgi:hypothetical protein
VPQRDRRRGARSDAELRRYCGLARYIRLTERERKPLIPRRARRFANFGHWRMCAGLVFQSISHVRP